MARKNTRSTDSDPMVRIDLEVRRSTRDAIDASCHAAGFKTRTRFLVQSALASPVRQREELGAGIGRLGMQCNEIIVAANDGAGLSRRQKSQVINCIAAICDDLREYIRRGSCGPF